MKKTTVILFRGRNTEGILRDAQTQGLVPDGSEVVVICRKADPLAQPGDVSAYRAPNGGPDDDSQEFLIIGNGGTTGQVVPLIADFAAAAQRWDDEADDYLRDSRAESARFASRQWRWAVWDVQPEGSTFLAGDRRQK